MSDSSNIILRSALSVNLSKGTYAISVKPQMATVLSNADPEGKGRVRVRMNWQTDGMQTGWVRVMTLMAVAVVT